MAAKCLKDGNFFLYLYKNRYGQTVKNVRLKGKYGQPGKEKIRLKKKIAQIRFKGKTAQTPPR